MIYDVRKTRLKISTSSVSHCSIIGFLTTPKTDRFTIAIRADGY